MHTSTPGFFKFTGFTGIAATVAALAAFASVTLGLPLWAMFIGWVAYFTRGLSARDGAINLACVVFGIAFGMAGALFLKELGPALGAAALPLLVFVIAAVVVSLRAAPLFNNLLSYFLGLISYFAAHMAPNLETLGELGAVATIGSVAAWLSHVLQGKLARAH